MQDTKSETNIIQQQLVIKLSYGPEELRIVTLEQPSFDLLEKKVATVLGLTAGSFALRYFDEEKDLITASSDEELQLAINYAAPSGVLRLQVAPRQAQPGEKRRRSSKHSSSDLEADVDQQAVAFLVEQVREQHAREVKPKKCAKFLRRTNGDVALALAAIDAWCLKRVAKELKKKEKKAIKHGKGKEVAVDQDTKRGDDEAEAMTEEESPELKEKLDQLEAKGYPKRKKNAKLLDKCGGDVEKFLEVHLNKEAKREAKKEWKRAKKSRKCDKKAHKREHKLERKGSKAAFKHHKKQAKHEAKRLKQQYRVGYQELSVAPSSPMPIVGA